jgi:hypothetical protein
MNYLQVLVAERVGFEPTYSLLDRNSISSRARYDLFGTSPATQSLSKLVGSPNDNWEFIEDVWRPDRTAAPPRNADR